MEAAAYVEAHRLACFRNCGGAAYRPGGSIKCRKKSIAKALDLAPTKSRQLLPHRFVMPIQQGLPVPVSQLGPSLCRLKDVSEQDSSKHAVRLNLGARPGQELLHFVDKPISMTDG